ncbi:MAG: hypothetical protein ACXWCW_29845 [Burkholderiales bacterium]
MNAQTDTQIFDIGGTLLRGAIGSINSESGWITSNLTNIRYGLDTQGELLIKDTEGHITTVAHYQGGPNVSFDDQTAGSPNETFAAMQNCGAPPKEPQIFVFCAEGSTFDAEWGSDDVPIHIV